MSGWRQWLALTLGLLVVVLWIFSMGEGIWYPDPNAPDLSNRLAPPSEAHWLGTDQLGRDVGARMISGAGVSLSAGILGAGVAAVIGILIGAIAGFAGGKVDAILMRGVDALLCFPSLLLILSLAALLGPGLGNVVLVIGLVSWTTTARLMRAEMLSLRESTYCEAARVAGARGWRIMGRHLLPNALPPVLAQVILTIPEAIIAEASLSFLGLGVRPPQASWGNLIADARQWLLDAWWMLIPPGVAIFALTLLFVAIGRLLQRRVNVV